MLKKFVTTLIIVFFLLAGYIALTAVNLPNVQQAIKEGIQPSQTSKLLAADGTVIMAQGKFFYKRQALSEISPFLIDALLATEDRRFYDHGGLDPVGVMRAVFTDISHSGFKQGGSTLTQQLAKNVFLTNERSFERKIKEALLAIKLEHQLSKQQILELYLNYIYLGEGAYGVEAASEIYFGKSSKHLTLAEAALIAGLPQAPSRYNPFINPDLAKKRREVVLNNLLETQKINESQFEEANNAPIHLNPNGRNVASSDYAPYFDRYVLNQVMTLLNIDEQLFWQQGLKVYTTLDYKNQVSAVEQLKSKMAAYGRTSKVNQAALLSIDNQGRMIAYVGGRDFMVSQFDIVSQAKRQAGSLFKVFVYTTAINQGVKPQTVFNDAPYTIDGWEPKNYDKGHRGYMTMAKALTLPNNVIATKVAVSVGIPNVIETARQMGIISPLPNGPALALGAASVNLLEMTTAFSVIANNGELIEPYAIDKIVDRSGQVIYQHMPHKRTVLNRQTRDTMVKMMRGVVQYGTGQGANLPRFTVAGKTGTSDDYRDAWFIGYTPDIITGVWVGNEDNSRMPGISGGSLPAGIWRGYMSNATKSLPKSSFKTEQAMPLSSTDFFEYNIANLSDFDKNSPTVQTRITDDAFAEDPLNAELPPDEQHLTPQEGGSTESTENVTDTGEVSSPALEPPAPPPFPAPKPAE